MRLTLVRQEGPDGSAACRPDRECLRPQSTQPQRAAGATSGRTTELMAKPVVVVTGVSGNLGSRLLPLLGSLLGDRGGRESAPNRLRDAV